METFEIEYYYYKYNTGRADNGNYTKRIECKTLYEAEKARAKILYCLRNTKNQGRRYDAIIDEFLPNPGYFTSIPIVYKVSRCIIQ